MRFFSRPILSILALTMLIGLTTVSAQAQKIYVDPCKEAEGPADGTEARPYSTLSRAVTVALEGSTIVLQGPCAYPETRTDTYPETSLLTIIRKRNLRIEARGGPARIGQPLGTRRLWQITGENDLERRVFTPGRTASSSGVVGTDLGIPVEHDG